MWAAAAGARVISARAIGEADLPSALATGALVVEDAAAAEDERALFHLINLAREEKAFLLITARVTPAGMARLRCRTWLAAARAAGGDAASAGRCDAARGHGQGRQPTASSPLTKASSSYLSTHIERSFAAARAAVIALDNEALRQRRPATRALAAEIFREQA